MAEYTSLSRDDCEDLIAAYGWDFAIAEPILGGAANSSFRVSCTDRDDVVLTVLDNHDLLSAEVLVKVTDWVVSHGVSTPPILRTAAGAGVSRLGEKPVVIRPFIGGKQATKLTEKQAFTLGSTARILHSIEPPADLGLTTRRLPPDWRDQLGDSPPHALVGAVAEAETLFERRDRAGRSLVHGDLFPDNLLWSDSGELCLLDWETASVDWPCLDLGFAACGLAPDGRLSEALKSSLLAGYSKARPFPSQSDFAVAVAYACAVTIFHRYRRHVVRFPNPNRLDYWRELLPLLESEL